MLEEPRAVLAELGVGLITQRGDERAAERIAIPRAGELEYRLFDVVVEVR